MSMRRNHFFAFWEKNETTIKTLPVFRTGTAIQTIPVVFDRNRKTPILFPTNGIGTGNFKYLKSIDFLKNVAIFTILRFFAMKI